MSRNSKSYYRRHEPREVYVPPFRKFASNDFDSSNGSNSGGGGGSSGGRGGGGRRGGGGGRRFDNQLSRDDFNDGPKGGGGHVARFDPYRSKGQRGRNRKNRFKGNRNTSSMEFIQNGPQWFKVQVPVGKRLGKEFILRVLNEVTPTPFIPYDFKFDGNGAVFYIDDFETANILRTQNRQIETNQGFKMSLVVNRSLPPIPTLDGDAFEALKLTMSNRYHSDTNLLDLSSFQNDPDMKRQGIFMPLHRPRVFDAALKIIKEHIPQLEALDLSSNKIHHLSSMSGLVVECKNLKSLSLKNNNISSMSDLSALKGYESIEEIILDGNPVCDNYKDQASYISAVREKFPKVIKLDGEALPPPIVFDLGCTTALPDIKGSFFPSVEAQQLIVQFLETYYAVYDSPSRQGLLDAYHDEALYSLSTNKSTVKGTGMQEYYQKSRNLLKVAENGQRNNLHEGKLEVVAFLNKLPATNHDPKSMTLDVAHVSPTLMTFTVMGVFKEVSEHRDPSNSALRMFSRSFAVVPTADQRIIIINDTHYVGNATVEQIKAYKASQDSKPKSVDIVDTKSSNSSAGGGTNDETARKQFVVQLSQMTGMNLPFSMRCLEENNWDIKQAFGVYEQLKNDGCIPPEAFSK